MSAPPKAHGEPTSTQTKHPLHGASKVIGQSSKTQARLVVTRGLDFKPWRDIYPFLLSTSWPWLLTMIVVWYMAINAAFGALYWLDPGGVENTRPGSFPDAFFFSIQTFGTIGYGKMAPLSTMSHVVVTVEAIVSMLSVAMITGLIFSKFSRPTARVMFSRVAVITTWDGQRSLVFRLANERGTQIADAQISVSLSRIEKTADGGVIRRIHDLELTRARNPNFVFAWTVIHPIHDSSPLWNQTVQSLETDDAFIGISVMGVDEVFSQTVYARHRYGAEDLRVGHDFVSILDRLPDGRRLVDYTHFHDTEPEELDEVEALAEAQASQR